MAGRVIVSGRGSNLVAFAGLCVLSACIALGLYHTAFGQGVVARAKGAACVVSGTAGCPSALPTAIPTALPTAGPGRTSLPTEMPTGVPTTLPTAVSTGQNGTGQWPASRPRSQQERKPAAPLIPPAALPYLIGGLALFLAVWWDVPGRLIRCYKNSPGGRARAHAAKRRREVEALRAEAMDADAANAAPAIASVDPGVAVKGMRVAVRGCEVTLRAGPEGTIALERMLAGTGDKEFARASRVVRERLADPEFVGELIAATGRAADYLEVNPHFLGAQARRAELLALSGALERVGNGLSD